MMQEVPCPELAEGEARETPKETPSYWRSESSFSEQRFESKSQIVGILFRLQRSSGLLLPSAAKLRLINLG